MQEQVAAQLPFAALASCVRSEWRSHLWTGMAAVMSVTGIAAFATPIPFWNAEITSVAVIGINVAIISVTCALAASYDSTIAWASGFPTGPATSIAIVQLGRLIPAAAAACASVVLQTMAMSWFTGDHSRPSWFGLQAASASLITALVLLPWSTLARLAVGPRAASWAVLGLALIGSGLSNASAPLRFAALAFPAIPLGPAGTAGTGWGLWWLYALSHSAAVTAVTVPLLRRYR